MSDSAANGELCDFDHWEIARIYGPDPGYLLTLCCAAGHLHYADRFQTREAARGALDHVMDRVLGELWTVQHVGPFLVDHPAGVIRFADGRQWPLQQGSK